MINQQDYEGNTPFHYLLSRYPGAIAENTDSGRDSNSDSSDSEEEYNKRSCDQACNSVIKKLITQGANLSLQNAKHKTPLHLYSSLPLEEDDSHEVLKNLTVEDCTIQDNEGDTVLHKLAQFDHLHWCNKNLLLAADSSILNHAGRSVLHEACYVPVRTVTLMILLNSPIAKLTQQESTTKRTPLAILLQKYREHPCHQTALAIQFLLNHPESSKMLTEEAAKIATPRLLARIWNSKQDED